MRPTKLWTFIKTLEHCYMNEEQKMTLSYYTCAIYCNVYINRFGQQKIVTALGYTFFDY